MKSFPIRIYYIECILLIFFAVGFLNMSSYWLLLLFGVVVVFDTKFKNMFLCEDLVQIASSARKEGMEAFTFSTNSSGKYYKKLPPAPEGHFYYSTFAENFVHLSLGMVTGYQECFGQFNTWRLLKKIDDIQPDIIHLHNLHYFIHNYIFI